MKKCAQSHNEERKRVAEEMLPEYSRRAHGLPWGPGSIFGEEETGNIMVFSPDLPYRDLNVMATDPDGTGFSFMTPLPRYFLEGAHPFLKLGAELKLNRQLARDKEFGAVEAPPALRAIVPTFKNPYAQPGDDDENVPYMDERLLYVYQTILPDIATWERFLSTGAETFVPDLMSKRMSTPEEKQKRRLKIVADSSGIVRFVPVNKAQAEGAYFTGQTEKLTGRVPRKAPK